MSKAKLLDLFCGAQVIAFDPATRTGWAYYNGSTWYCGSFELGDSFLKKLIIDLSPTCSGLPVERCVCEDPHFNRGNGKSIHFAMRDIEHAWGAVSNDPVQYIALSTWRAFHGIKKSKGDLKQQAIDIALKLGAPVLKNAKGKYDDNAAEAVCIAVFAMQRQQVSIAQ